MIVLAIGCRLVMDEVDQDVSALANWTFGPPAASSACFLGKNNREETLVGQYKMLSCPLGALQESSASTAVYGGPHPLPDSQF
jgi:hypothetical protein